MHLACLLVLLPGLAHAIDDWMPVVEPHGFDQLDDDAAAAKGLRRALPKVNASGIRREAWTDGRIPHVCFAEVRLNGDDGPAEDPKSFDVFNATFADCDAPWTVCRHKNSSSSEEDIVKGLAAIPAGMREAASVVVALPDGHPNWADGGAIFISDAGGWADPTLLQHELTHVLDWTALSPRPDHDFWSYGSAWRAAVAKDGAVPATYGASVPGPETHNLRETFAEVGWLALYDLTVDGGLAKLHPNVSGVGTQLEEYKRVVGEARLRSARCSGAKAGLRKVVEVASVKKAEKKHGVKGGSGGSDTAVVNKRRGVRRRDGSKTKCSRRRR